MKSYAYKLAFLFLLINTSAPSFANDDQFFFIAREAPIGSITAEGQGSRAVYLRWGSIEGKLPDDVVAFRLLRNNELVGEFPVNEVMPVAELNKLYLGSAQKRRRLEVVTKLNELAAANGDEFSAASFATYLHDLINPASDQHNPLWSFLGSQTDFNIARARFRAWVDVTPGTINPVEYELLAVNALGGTARLGLVRVKTGAPTVLLGATDLKQHKNSDTRCDYPEDAKDHFTVALDWKSAGEGIANLSVTDQFASKLYLSGYDLYRGDVNLDANIEKAPVRDIATLAAQVATDSRGNPKIVGLEKINTSLIIDSGSVAGEAKFLEARDLLKRAGLKPGDRRAYYLVARDFTGNYGPTAKAVVIVPLTTRPPAPWNISTFADETSSASLTPSPDGLLLSWNKVDLTNYMRIFKGTRKYCNATEAEQTGILEFVGVNQNCETDLHSSVRLDVSDYRVYRFTDFDVAGRFSDSDGDGVSDAVERQIGSQCDASVQPQNAVKYLAPDIDLTTIAGGDASANNPATIRLRDEVPAGNKDTVYWYRIASVAGDPKNERLSFLSAPQRGFFPDREPPNEPIVEVLREGDTPTGCRIESDARKEWHFEEQFSAFGQTPYGLKLSCSGASAGGFSNADSDVGSARCQSIIAQDECSIGNDISLTLGGVAGLNCQVSVPDDISFCRSGEIKIIPTYDLESVQPGDLVSEVTVTVRPPDDKSCVALYENIDGAATRIASSCEDTGITYNPGAGLFCGYAVATDQNNNISTTVPFPCTLVNANPKALSAPQVLTLAVNDTDATLTFRMPAEQAAVAMVRLNHEKGNGGGTRKIESVPVVNVSSGEIVTHKVPVDALQATKDRFCLQLKAIARDTGDASLNSPWSKQRCYTRRADGEDTVEYLPWPTVKPAAEGEALQAIGGVLFSNNEIGFDIAGLPEDEPDFIGVNLAFLIGQLGDKCYFQEIYSRIEKDNLPDELFCNDAGRAAVQSALKPQLNYLLYRQKKKGNLEGNWIQVSPLIEFAHFEKLPPNYKIKEKSYHWRLKDPFIKFLKVRGRDAYGFLHHDRYPFLTGKFLGKTLTDHEPYDFRYQAVYFDKNHRPIRWRQSNWFKVD